MHPPGADTVVIRHGEIGTKSEQVRRKMEARLRDNVAAILADRGIPGEVVRERTRLYVHTDPGAVGAAAEAAADAFGVVSTSPAVTVPPEEAAITDALAAAAREHYDGGSFAVRARRAGDADAHPFTSEDLETAGGNAVWEAAEAAGYEPRVDLEAPDHTLFVECRPEEAFVFCERLEGPGGLPVGTQEPLVALVSGGIDSPVAAWEAMRRGAPVVPLYVDLGEYGGADHRQRAVATVRGLARFAPHLDLALRVAPGGEAVDRLVEEMDARRMLGLRRFMYRVAARVAGEHRAVGVVTGEAIGQKSSQTTANLGVASAVTDLPIHRPLLARDKPDITEQARAIGTYEDATVAAGCNRVAPSFPETNATLAAVRAAEPADIEALAEAAAAGVEAVPGPATPE